MAYITPNLWTPWIQEQLQKTANLISMGLVTVDTNAKVSESGQFQNIPMQSPLTANSNVQRITSSTTLIPTATSQVQEIGVVCHTGDSYYLTEVDKLETGFDALAGIAPQITKVAIDGIQTYLVSATKGIFYKSIGPLYDTHVYEPASETLDVDTMTDGMQSVYGENMDDLDAIIMHSAKFAAFKKDALVTYVNAGDFGANILYSGKIPTILGKRVLINDTLCATFTDGAATKYPTYLVKGQPWYLGYQKTLDVKYDEDILTGAGKMRLAWYQHFLPHLKGVSWTSSTANPTTTNLETATNWTQKAQDYSIGIMRINTL